MPSRSGQQVISIIINADDNASPTLRGVGEGIQRFGQAAVAAFAVAGAAATAFAISSINEFAQFQQGMNEVFTLIPDASGEMLDRMDTQVKRFAARFGTLPNDVIPALYQAISAGVPADNVFTFLEVAQKAAIGGVTELETAVDGISSVVNAYGADVLSAANASDLMFTSVRLGKTTLDELSQSLFQVTPTAASLGLEFGNVTAALAAMTSQGVPTRVAATQLRQLLVELSRAGSEASDAFTQIAGVGIREFLAQGGNLQDALVIMQRAADQTGVSLADMFGSVEAGNAALALTGAGTERFTAFLAEMEASAGATDTAFETMEKGLGRSFDRLRASFSVLRIEVGERLAPLVQPLVDGLTSIINAATMLITGDFRGGIFGLEEDTPQIVALLNFRSQFIGMLTEWRDRAQEIWTAMRRLMEPVGEFLARIGEFIGQHVEWKDVLIAIGIALSAAVVPGLIKMLGAILGLSSPLGLLITAISLIRAAWETDFLGIRTFIETQVIPALGPFFEQIGIWIETEALPALQRLADWFTIEVLPRVLDFIRTVIIPGIQEFIRVLQEIWTAVQPVIQGLIDWFVTTGWPLIQAIINDVIIPIVEGVITSLQNIWVNVEPIINQLVDWFTTTGWPIIRGILQRAGEVITPFINLVRAIWERARGPLEELKRLFDATIGWVIRNILGPAIEQVEGLIEALGRLIGVTEEGPVKLRPLSPAFTSLVNKRIDPITGGGRALGGDIMAGVRYTVGERGPETFVSSMNGRIESGGSGAITINFNGAGPSSASEADEYGRIIVRRLRSEGL